MADGALSPAEVAHFLAFGYVHRRQCFSAQEMAMLTERADELLGRSPPENGFLEPVLGDARVVGAVDQLMGAMGAPRYLFGGASHLAAGPIPSSDWTGYDSLPADAPSKLDPSWQEHGCASPPPSPPPPRLTARLLCTGHSDIPGPSECYPRIKTMLYLTPTTKERGAIRFIAGSHTPEYQQHLKRLQGWHGIHTTHPQWAEGTFGVTGPELPSVAIESSVGDFVIFHHSLCTYRSPLSSLPACSLLHA